MQYFAASPGNMRSPPVFKPNSDEASREDDGKWNSDTKISEGSNTSPDIRLADNDAQIWKDRPLFEMQLASTKNQQGESLIKDEGDVSKGNTDDEKLNIDVSSSGGSVNYLRYSMCRST